MGVTLKNLPLIDPNGLNENGNIYQNLPPSSEFLATIFTEEIGMDIPLIESEGNAIFKVRVDNIVEPRLMSLETVTDQVIASWKSTWQDQHALETATNFIDVATLATFDEAAGQLGLLPIKGAPFTRTGIGLEFDVNQQTVDAVFDLSIGGLTNVIKLDSGKYVVANLSKIENDTIAAESEVERITRELKNSLQTDILAVYQLALRQKYKLIINDQALENLF